MKAFTVVCLLAVVSASLAGRQLHPLSDEFIAEINSKQSTWKAGRNFDISEYGLFKKLASGSKGIKNRDSLVTRLHDEDVEIPESFDSREAWPECADIIGLIRDQSRCGACWAFAAAEAMSDRICIHSNGERKILVSSQDVLTCTEDCGCDGGYLDIPWSTWYSNGYVTGGLYNNTDQGCKSYFLPNCEDHPNRCTNYVDTPECLRQCDDTSLNYEAQKTYGQVPSAFWNEKQIKLEILKYGPVETGFTVYEDFASYKSGIYQHVSGAAEGGHAVKIIGWGVENGVKYWTIANSWNERWGEDGFFRILRGVNECGIEDEVVSGLPDFSKF
ncbi:cathepsin B-like [Rhynchophorus ferrugineus]|uniref:cathepsin B-like n=1 Tax=Rhynchophorus ferrugineus TaxID=354439 RepID=UPI003FCE3D33